MKLFIVTIVVSVLVPVTVLAGEGLSFGDINVLNVPATRGMLCPGPASGPRCR